MMTNKFCLERLYFSIHRSESQGIEFSSDIFFSFIKTVIALGFTNKYFGLFFQNAKLCQAEISDASLVIFFHGNGCSVTGADNIYGMELEAGFVA